MSLVHALGLVALAIMLGIFGCEEEPKPDPCLCCRAPLWVYRSCTGDDECQRVYVYPSTCHTALEDGGIDRCDCGGGVSP